MGQLPKPVYDQAELRAVAKAFNDAWRQVSPHVGTDAEIVDAARLTLAGILLNLTKDGIGDPDKLTEGAVRTMLKRPPLAGLGEVRDVSRFSRDLTRQPEDWRKWAAEVRAIAATFKDQEAKRRMIKVAEAYEQLADRVEARR